MCNQFISYIQYFFYFCKKINILLYHYILYYEEINISLNHYVNNVDSGSCYLSC